MYTTFVVLVAMSSIILGQGAKLPEERSEFGGGPNYFKSYDAAGWYQARKDCKEVHDAELVTINSAEKLQEVVDFILAEGDVGTTFWTGGRWNPMTKRFEWGDGTEIGNSVLWPDRPGTGTQVEKVMLHRSGESGYFETSTQTTSYRYVCERLPKPTPCPTKQL